MSDAAPHPARRLVLAPLQDEGLDPLRALTDAYAALWKHACLGTHLPDADRAEITAALVAIEPEAHAMLPAHFELQRLQQGGEAFGRLLIVWSGCDFEVDPREVDGVRYVCRIIAADLDSAWAWLELQKINATRAAGGSPIVGGSLH